MIRLASVIKTFEADLLQQGKLLPGQLHALNAIKSCRSEMSPKMQAECGDCEHQIYVPHSCGHRSCPNCQAHESQRWIECQVQKLVPGDYFMITFTLPAQLRPLALANRLVMYDLFMQCAWGTLRTFSQNDKKLQGTPGAVGVLHTHSRRLDFHLHTHMVIPAAAFDIKRKLWRTKKAKYLFNHKALAKVFRAKMLEGIKQAGLSLPERYPEKWVVDCKSVGTGAKALVYLGRYLYRGVIREKDILACENGQVTFRYQNSKTKKIERKTVGGVEFLRLILQHVLPKGFRRARNFGFLHPNSKRLIHLVQMLLKQVPNPILVEPKKRPTLRCPCCGGEMKIVRTRIKSVFAWGSFGQGDAGLETAM
jgi:hypothetical protein